jgi:hypothetical protein
MSEIILKPNILGYYYINASKTDKQMALYFQMSETEAYFFNIVFPKCRVSYIFLFRNPVDNLMYLSTKAAKNLTDAMDQTNFAIRRPILAIIVGDPERKTINFITNDASDQNNSLDLFDPSCRDTEFGRYVQSVVRQGVLDGNAGTDLTLWLIDGPQAGRVVIDWVCGDPSFGSFAYYDVNQKARGISMTSSMLDSLCQGDFIYVTDVEEIYNVLVSLVGNAFAIENYRNISDPKNSRERGIVKFDIIST